MSGLLSPSPLPASRRVARGASRSRATASPRCSAAPRRAAAAAASAARLADPLLVGLGVDDVATGGTSFAQGALSDALARGIASGRLAVDASLGDGAEAQAAAARELLAASGVRRRGSQRAAEDFFVTTPGLPPLAADALLDRLEAAASRALARWVAAGGEGAQGITHLVIGSLTPPRSAPGPDVALLTRLGLPATTQRLPQHHLGCHGGLRSLALGAQIARGNPAARVLVVYGDVMSMLGAFMPTPIAAEDVRSVALFTDGAAAAVVSGAGFSAAGCAPVRPLARVVHSRSELLRPREGASDAPRLRASYNAATEGMVMQMSLPRDWAAQTGHLLGPFTDALLAECAEATGVRVAPADACFALQPSGGDALAAAAAALRLAPWQAAPAAAVLAARGAASGAGALMALAAALDCAALRPRAAAAAAPRRHAVALALGPGITAEGLVLELP